ncbi:amino acid ABC transporter permease [Paraburkholderia sp. GAS334]|uniref:amino acid ABC transporter permease n=1 Tax=Paraburkholderia sp. GAS334 TaxID=3035131 RepID=UPI003D1C4C31
MAMTIGRWARYNLFASPSSSLLSVVSIPLTVYVGVLAARWALFTAHWPVVVDNLTVLLVGTFPVDQIWRALVAGAGLSALFGMTIGLVLIARRWKGYAIAAALLAVAAAASYGTHLQWIAGAFGCLSIVLGACAATSRWPQVGRGMGLLWLLGVGTICALLAPAGVDRWGGLLLSILVTAIATLLSLPVGIALAFGRNSRFSSLRLACSGYIELLRSVPLVCTVYWSWIIIPLVFPPQVHIPDLARGVAGFVLFYAAYAAEYVRSGIQGVPQGQSEAAQSLGFSKLDESFIIVLPQALKAVIPALVGNVLDLFNNVPALFIIGLTDFLKAGQTVLANPQYSSSQYEVYVFLFAAYLAIGSLISYGARRIELKMSQGAR